MNLETLRILDGDNLLDPWRWPSSIAKKKEEEGQGKKFITPIFWLDIGKDFV